MYSLLLSSSSNSAFDSAWNSFLYVVNWMRSTDILTFGDVTFSFWNVAIGLLTFGIISDFILKLFWGD